MKRLALFKLHSLRPTSILRTFLLCLLAALLIVNPANAALSEDILDFYNLNDIFYYNPQGGGALCYSGNLSGDTIMAKVVSYLKGNNPTGFVLSDNGIAGILANFEAESGFNPFRFQNDRLSGPAYGIAQFDGGEAGGHMEKILEPLRTDPRTANYYNTYFDLKYTYYDTETGFPKEPVPMEVIDAWLAVQLDYFFDASSEFENTKVGTYRNKGGQMGLDYISSSMTAHEAMDAAQSPEDATRIFVWIMERPGDKPGDSNKRSKQAQKWLSFVQQMSVSNNTTAVNMTASGAKVTIIGDSVTAAAAAQLSQKLPGVDIHASNSLDGLATLHSLKDNNQLRETVIYALGTDQSLTVEQLQEVVNVAGTSRKVIFVNNWSAANDYTANNNALTKIKNDNNSVRIADWKSAISGQEETYLEADGILPNAAGQELFAQILANSVNANGSTLSTCAPLGLVEGGMDQSQAQKLADYYNSDEVDGNYWHLPLNGKKDNCVSFVAFFVQRFTTVGRLPTYRENGWGDGRNVAHKLAEDEGLPTGNEPRPYAVFAVTQGDQLCEGNTVACGHTGVVVAVDGNTVTTVEAALNKHGAVVRQRDISYFVNTKYGYSFVYLDSILNQADLLNY